MMTSADSRAASVSKKAVRMEALGMSTSEARYEPYTIMPEPVMDKEKNACPMAITQVLGSARYSQRGTNRNR